MSNAFTGIGTRFMRLTGTDWLSVGGVTNVSGPGATRETVDTTSFDNEDGYRAFIASLRDSGTLTFDMLFSKAQYQQLLADFEENGVQRYMLLFAKAQAGAITFDGLVTDLPLNIPLDDRVTVSVTIKVTGAIDLPAQGPYLVRYDANNATSGSTPVEQVKLHGVTLTLRKNTGAAALKRTGHTFVGWNTKADGSGTPFNAGANFALNEYVTLFAEWEAD